MLLGRKAGKKLWAEVAIALAGLYLLCINPGEGTGLGYGDILVLCCALAFAFQILTVDYFSARVDGVLMAWMQFLTCGLESLIAALIFETISFSAMADAWIAIFYAGALSSGVGYTLQIIGQRDVDPTVASLIMSLESAFSVVAAWIILGQSMSPRELIGCGLMFAAIIIAQLPGGKASPKDGEL